ncbi:MAG: PDZ domain-containing protein [Planctomycetota bacterium]|nr:PDZ domain-containing protein [Planctomycetota bacterium]
MKLLPFVLLLGFPLLHVPVSAQDAPALPSEWASKITWRSVGPAAMGGRIVELSVYEKDPSTFYAATASGGLLKTVNNGITFEHQFDKETTVSIGAVCMSQSNPDVVYVGTGEENPRNSVSYGDGVYKSVDGGKTWKNMGLKKTFQIGAIAVHPTNPDIVYVGALGRLYGPNEERGLYKSTNGGKDWVRIHFVDAKTGVIAIEMNPKNPDTLIFATYERQRDGFDGNPPAKKIAPGSGMYRTTDGGATFEKLTKGLPTCNWGRVGIDYYQSDPNIIYAIIESEMMGKPGMDIGWSGISSVSDAKTGAKVETVSDKSPASKAGLQKGDIILSINNEKVESGSKLPGSMTRFKTKQKVSMEIAREGKNSKIEFAMGTKPKSSSGSGTRRGGRGSGRRGGSSGSRPHSMNISFGGRLGGQSANLQDFQGEKGYEHGGLFQSKDGGTSWTRVNSIDPRPMYFSQFRVDPSDTKYQYVLGISGSRSVDGGKTFTSDATRGVHADQHALWINPSNGKHMILGCDGGIYVTYDRTKTWAHLNHMAIGQFYHAKMGPRRDYWVYGGLQDNGTWGAPHRTARGGPVNSDWLRIGGGDGFVVAIDANDPDQIYYESQNGATQSTNLRTMARGSLRFGSSSRQRGSTAQRGGTGQRGTGQRGGDPRSRGTRGSSSQRTRTRYNWKTPFILSSHNSRIYYNVGNYVFRSLDRGRDLKKVSPDITLTDRGSGTAIAESPMNPDVLYVGSDDGALWGTRKGDHEWSDLRKAPVSEASHSKTERKGGPRGNDSDSAGVPFTQIVTKPMWISSIEASRYSEGRVYVTVDGHRSDDDNPYVLVSENYGQSWTSLHAKLPRGSTRVVREDYQNENLLYLGTEFGLYVSLNRGQSWTRFHNNLPTVAIHEVAQHKLCGDVLLATHGRSLWIADMTPLRQLTTKNLAKDVFACQPAEVILWKSKHSRGSSGGASKYVGTTPSSQAQVYFHLKNKPSDLTVAIHGADGKVYRDLKIKTPTAGLNHVTWDLRRNSTNNSGGSSNWSSRRGGRGRSSGSAGTYKLVVTADGKTSEATFKVSPQPE